MEPAVGHGKQEGGIALEMYSLNYQITFDTFVTMDLSDAILAHIN